jgi:photosystem II stability/assembly factor-like uncharacterized protein
MKWIARADNLDWPTKILITFACAVFGFFTTLLTLTPSKHRPRRYAAGEYGGGRGGGRAAPAYRPELSLPLTKISEPGRKMTAMTLLPDGELAGVFVTRGEVEFSQTSYESVWGDKTPLALVGETHKLHFTDDKNGWAFDSDSNLIRTTDGGANWQNVELPEDLAIGEMAWVSPQIGFIAGAKYGSDDSETEVRILRTTNGGRSWQEAGSFASKYAVWQLLAPTARNLILNLGGNELYLSNDGGQNWREALVEGVIENVVCDKAGDGWVLARQTHRLHKYGADISDEADTLVSRTPAKKWRAMDIGRNGLGMAVGYDNLVAVTKDGGKTWREAGLTLEAGPIVSGENYERVQVRGETALISSEGRAFRVDLSSLTRQEAAGTDAPRGKGQGEGMGRGGIVIDAPPPPMPQAPPKKIETVNRQPVKAN